MFNVLAKLPESLPKFDFMKSVLYHSHDLDYLIVFEFMNIYLYVIMTQLSLCIVRYCWTYWRFSATFEMDVPEIYRCISEFEASLSYFQQKNEFEYEHHEQVSSRQQRYSKQVLSLVLVITNMKNPLLEKSEDLVVLDTRKYSK